MSVRLVKLVDGSELVGELTTISEKGMIKIKRPMRLDLLPSGNGYGIGLTPAVLGNSELMYIEIKLEHVLFDAQVDKEVEKNYLQQTSGIQLATSL